MHGLGHVLKLFYADWGPFGDAVILVLAVAMAWLGFRYSASQSTLPSIRHRRDD